MISKSDCWIIDAWNSFHETLPPELKWNLQVKSYWMCPGSSSSLPVTFEPSASDHCPSFWIYGKTFGRVSWFNGRKIVTALAKPNPSWSQIRLGLELGNASEATHPTTPPHRNSNQPISQPFLNGLSWNFAWWLPRWLGWSLESKQWPCSTAVFHAAL